MSGRARTVAGAAVAGVVVLAGALGVSPASAARPGPGTGVAQVQTVDTSSTTSTTTSTTETTTTSTTTTTTTAPTTTTSTSTTTTTVPAASASSSFPWGWLVLALALLGAAVAVIVMAVGRRNRQQAEAAWRRATVGALDGARLAQGLLPASGSDIPEPVHWQEVRNRVDQAAAALDVAAQGAPSPEGAEAVRSSAGAMRNLVFALEADRLLRDGTRAPTPEQLAQADATSRARRAELDAGLARLDRLVHPPPRP
jgi:hypothetical protein